MPQKRKLTKGEMCRLHGDYEKSKKHPFVLTWEITPLEYAIKQTKYLYKYNVEARQKMINYDMKQVYGRTICFKENETTTMEIAIKSVIKETKCSMSDIASRINTHCQEKVCFFRNSGDKRVPVELERIKQAYFAAMQGKTKEDIYQILYNEDNK